MTPPVDFRGYLNMLEILIIYASIIYIEKDLKTNIQRGRKNSIPLGINGSVAPTQPSIF